jgi:hypothetical protein
MLMVFTSGDGGGGERWGRIGRKRAPPPPIQDDDLRRERESAKLGDGGLVDLRS